MNPISIGKFTIQDNSPAFIIAEAGVNHNGDVSLAKELVDVAVQAKVDAIKFQSFKPDNLILQNIRKAPYQLETTNGEENQYDMLTKLSLNIEQMTEIYDYCQSKNILFMSTPFDPESAAELNTLGVEAFKIASTDTTNLLLLEQIANYGKPIILSTGMCSIPEIEKAYQTISEINERVILLQCTANYPVQPDEVNLSVINEYKKLFNCYVGFSDHTEGLGAAPYAIACGANVLEKHFTLDKSMPGPDHRASLSPQELDNLVSEVRVVERYLGSGNKVITDSEVATKSCLQKCYVTTRDLPKGAILSKEDLIAKRTGGVGISALELNSILGHTLNTSLTKDSIITSKDLL